MNELKQDGLHRIKTIMTSTIVDLVVLSIAAILSFNMFFRNFMFSDFHFLIVLCNDFKLLVSIFDTS